MSPFPGGSHGLTFTYTVSSQELRGEVEGPQSSPLLSWLFWGRVSRRNKYRKRRQKEELYEARKTNDKRRISMGVGHSFMVISHLHHFIVVFLGWHLPSIFYSCLFQVDVCFRENTLQKENSCYTAIKNNLKVKSINISRRVMPTSTKGIPKWVSGHHLSWPTIFQRRKDGNTEIVEIKIWAHDA